MWRVQPRARFFTLVLFFYIHIPPVSLSRAAEPESRAVGGVPEVLGVLPGVGAKIKNPEPELSIYLWTGAGAVEI